MPTPTTLLDDALAREMLSHDELDRAARFVRIQDALAFRSSRALLRLVLGYRLGLSPKTLKFTRSSCRRCGGPHGKPVVGGPLRFSFSQTADLSGVAIGSSDVGFDVEAMITDLAAREIESALSVDEQTHLRSANDRGATATTIWVRKEAALKCTGDGITADLRGFSVFDNPVVLSDVAVWITDLPSQHGAAAAVASSVGPPHAQISVLGPDQIEALRAQVRG